MKIIYICGPMTGLPVKNFPAFESAATRLRASGYEVLNPTRHEKSDRSWQDYLRLGVIDVARSHGVCLLSGWEQSRGANLEVYVARSLEIPYRYEEWWLEQQP